MVREGLTPGAPVSQLVIDRRREIKSVGAVTAKQAKGTLRYNTKMVKRLAKTDPNVAAMVKSTESYHKMLRAEKQQQGRPDFVDRLIDAAMTPATDSET